MKNLLTLVLLILASVSMAFANLGDSDERIDNSYGKLVARHLLDDGSVSMLYHKDRYLYLVVFKDRRSVSETYGRVDGRELSEKEVSRFLKVNAGRGVTWKPEGFGTERRFERSDHSAEATFVKMQEHPALEVKSRK